MGINFKPYQKARTIIRFSSKFTILPFLYLQTIQTICHLFTIIYYGTSLHRSHVISHTLKLNHVSPNVSYTHAWKWFVPILIYQNKRSWQIFPRPNIINTRFVLTIRFLRKFTTRKPAVSIWYMNIQRHANEIRAPSSCRFSSGIFRAFSSFLFRPR